jgi:hypothetical protein
MQEQQNSQGNSPSSSDDGGVGVEEHFIFEDPSIINSWRSINNIINNFFEAESEDPPSEEHRTKLNQTKEELINLFENLDAWNDIDFEGLIFYQYNETIIHRACDNLNLSVMDDEFGRLIAELVTIIHKFLILQYQIEYTRNRINNVTLIHLTFPNNHSYDITPESFTRFVANYISENFEKYDDRIEEYDSFDYVEHLFRLIFRDSIGDNLTNMVFRQGVISNTTNPNPLLSIFRHLGNFTNIGMNLLQNLNIEQVSEREYVDHKYGHHNNHDIQFHQHRCERLGNDACVVCGDSSIGKCQDCGSCVCVECLREIKHRSGECPMCRNIDWKMILYSDVNLEEIEEKINKNNS